MPFFLGLIGHAASAATSAASSAAASTAASTAATSIPKGLDLLEKVMDLTKEAGDSQQKQPPKDYRSVLMERDRTAGKGMETQMALAKTGMSVQAGEKVIDQVKKVGEGCVEVMKMKEALKPKPEEDNSARMTFKPRGPGGP